MPDETAPIGHNQPPDVLEALHGRLTKANAPLAKRRDELLAACERMPKEIDDEEMAGKFAEMLRAITTAEKAAKAERKKEKQPHLDAGRAVDGFFATITAPLERAAAPIQKALDRYQNAKAAAERQRREEEAARARAEAERLAAAAENDQQLEQAVVADEHAAKAEKLADAPAADLGRVRGEYGAVSSLKARWTHEVEDLAKVDLEALRPYFAATEIDKAIRAYQRAHKDQIEGGDQPLRGVRFFQTHTTSTR